MFEIILYCFIFLVGYNLGERKNRLKSYERDCIYVIRTLSTVDVMDIQSQCGSDIDGLFGGKTLRKVLEKYLNKYKETKTNE